jgi:hypothetical protein
MQFSDAPDYELIKQQIRTELEKNGMEVNRLFEWNVRLLYDPF